MSVPLYMDHHVPRAITEGLRRRGVDVVTAEEDGTQRLEDPDLLDRATELGRPLFSQDRHLLAEAHDAGWGVIVKEALANGRLASQDQIAIAAALANPWVDVVLSGAVTVEQLGSNVMAATMPLAPDQLTELAKLAEPADQYWKERSQLAWS